MTKHRRITGFVAIALMAAVATISTTRSHSTDVASTGAIGTMNFDDRWSAISAPPSTETAESVRN